MINEAWVRRAWQAGAEGGGWGGGANGREAEGKMGHRHLFLPSGQSGVGVDTKTHALLNSLSCGSRQHQLQAAKGAVSNLKCCH